MESRREENIRYLLDRQLNDSISQDRLAYIAQINKP